MAWTIRSEREPHTLESGRSSKHPLRTLEIFFENTSRTAHPTLLDMGPASNSNIDFFGQKGFKIYVEDFLRDYLDPEHDLSSKTDLLDYRPSIFDGILCWDIFDFITPRDAEILIQRLFELLRGGGLIMALFDARTTPTMRYLMRHKIFEENEVVHEPLRGMRHPSHHYKNRQILQLFSRFEIVKSYYHKNRLREYLFRKLHSTIS